MAYRSTLGWLLVTIVSGACGPGTASGGFDGGDDFGAAPVVRDDDAGAVTQAIAGQVQVLGAASSQGVTVTLQPGNGSATTDSTGSFIFSDPVPGSYTVTASLAGYAPASQSVTLTAGNDATVDLTLERSRLIFSLGDAGLAAPFLAYDQWILTADGGRSPGTTQFFGAGDTVWQLLDGGPFPRSTGNFSQQLLGFDSLGGAVLVTSAGQTATQVVQILDPGPVALLPLQELQDPIVSGGTVFASRYSLGETTWYADAADFISPLVIATSIASRPAPVPAYGAMVGWRAGACPTAMMFGPTLSIPLTTSCAEELTPITSSLDGDRFAFISIADGGPWEVRIEGVGTAVIADGLIEAFVADGGSEAVYPLTGADYAITYTDASQIQQLVVDGPGGSEALPVAGWAPMHGDGILALELSAGQSMLTAVGTSFAIPFDYPWVQPLLSSSNRYVVFPGIASIFDLVGGIEAPLALTPASATFDRGETHALIADAAGNLSLVPLAQLSAGPAPQDVALEGIALAQSFTSDEQAIVYFGDDPEGNPGLFVEAFPAGL